ncbi:hypothetical protein [Deinococcus puniceus]|uniref:Uncharacterized protein n=1 Tax=Deinococcus puniceus TaxID=1182568 RepID=A0A172TA89_9DEIO|nr:hypothetical protein [Deinococcus puniceus]ANE43882.1 hypothetical protein SU48_08945 [Deinococcus puniceus]
MTAPPLSPVRRVQVGRWVSAVLALVLLAFSPTVAFYAQHLLGGPAQQAAPLPPARVGTLSAEVVRRYALTTPSFQAALADVRVSERRRLSLSELHYQTYLQASLTLGRARASAVMRLLDTEIRNQNPALSRRSVFGSPEAALNNVQDWLAFLAWAEANRPGDRTLARQAPVPIAPQIVRVNRQNLVRAANALHLTPGGLAGILDNEQAGARSGLGLSGWLRTFTDTVALRATEAYGSSGATGRLSRTVGLTQMGWEDAVGQADRLRSLKVTLNGPYPSDEAQARAALNSPYDHFLLSASRLRGYLLASLPVKPEPDTDPLDPAIQAYVTDAWANFLGPAWHNNPALASSGQTWPYAWNAFFKACLYEQRLFAR